MKTSIVTLSEKEREAEQELRAKRHASARTRAYAHLMLTAESRESGPGWTDQRMAEALDVSVATIERVRERLVEERLAAALTRHQEASPRLRTGDGEQEADLLALTAVNRRRAENVGRCYGWPTRWWNSAWWRASPEKPSDRFCPPTNAHPGSQSHGVCHMEEGRDGSTRPSDARYPQVCMDEMRTHRIRETRVPLPMQPGQPAGDDSEDRRQGTGPRCLATEPLMGARFLQVTEHRTKQDWARFMRDLVDVSSPPAEKLVDHVNTHTPAEARRLARKPDIHGSLPLYTWELAAYG